MIYLKICLAAIERYQLEKPLRDLYEDCASRKRLKRFPKPDMKNMLKYLVSRGLVLSRDAPLIRQRYSILSEVLHGRH